MGLGRMWAVEAPLGVSLDDPCFLMILDGVRMLLSLILPLDSLGDGRNLQEILAELLGCSFGCLESIVFGSI